MWFVYEGLYDTSPDEQMISQNQEELRMELNRQHLKAKIEKALNTNIPDIINQFGLSNLHFNPFMVGITDNKDQKHNIGKDKAYIALGAYDSEEEAGYVLYYETYLDGPSLWDLTIIKEQGFAFLVPEYDDHLDINEPEMYRAHLQYMMEYMNELPWIKNFLDLCEGIKDDDSILKYAYYYLTYFNNCKQLLKVYAELKDIMEFTIVIQESLEDFENHCGLICRDKSKHLIGIVESSDELHIVYLTEDPYVKGGYEVAGTFASNLNIYEVISVIKFLLEKDEAVLLNYVGGIKEYVKEIYMEKNRKWKVKIFHLYD